MTRETKFFRPFKTAFDENVALCILKDAVHGADDGELFLERHQSEIMVFEGGKMKTASYSASEGFGVRAVHGEASGYAHSTDLSEKALRQAAKTVRLARHSGAIQSANPPDHLKHHLYKEINPMSDADFSIKVETLKEIDTYARDLDKRVFQVSVSLSASLQEVEILRPEGLHVQDCRPLVRLNVSIIAEKNGRRETGSAGGGGRYSLSHLIKPDHWKPVVKEALRVALINLEAEPAPAGVFDVVLGNGWPGILLHEAVGHGLEGDFNRKKTSAFAGLMGKRVAAKGVTVLDDGTIPDRRGSLNFDDEGTPSGKSILIEDGILVGYMQDRQNARLMGMKPTGNGRRESYAHPPMPRMTNTYMLGGDTKQSDIIADLKDGIYAVGFGGGQVDITNGKFVFSCTEAYRVKNGVIGTPLKGATLIGDGATALKHIRAIGNDMALDPGMGNCGKAGQWVPVGVGQPTLLIGGLTIGGSQI